MSIMDIFRNKPQAPAVPPAPQGPGGNSAAANPTVPSAASPVQPEDANKSPVDKYQDLWKKDDTTPAPGSKSLIPNFDLDPAKLRDAASKIDFTAHLKPEDLTAASSGDAAALGRIINQAVQLGFAQSAGLAGEISKQHFTTAQSTLKDSVLPDAIRQSQLNAEMTRQNQVFSDPSVAPMLESLKGQFAAKYPTASPEEIGAMAKEYLGDFANKIVGGSGKQIVDAPSKKLGARAETDWGDFLSVPR